MADSRENKCPRCGGTGKFGVDTWTLIPDPCLNCGGSGRIQASGVEPSKPGPEIQASGDFLGDDLSQEHSCHAGCPCQTSGGESKPEPERAHDLSPACDSPPVDPQCRDCNDMGEIWEMQPGPDLNEICRPCPSCSPSVPDREGDARIEAVKERIQRKIDEVEASAKGTDYEIGQVSGLTFALTALALSHSLAASPSPDRETGGEAQVGRPFDRLAEEVGYDRAVELSKDADAFIEATASPSAAPTNPGAGSRSDSEGEGAE